MPPQQFVADSIYQPKELRSFLETTGRLKALQQGNETITSLVQISVAADRPDREEAGGSGSRGEAEHMMRCELKLWSGSTLDPSFPFTPDRTEREPPAIHLRE